MERSLFDIEKEFDSIRRQMNNLFNSMLKRNSFEENLLLEGPNFKSNNLIESTFKLPSADVYETDKEVVAKIELPGVKKEDIKLEIKENALKVNAKREEEKEEKRKGFHRIERSYSGFSRRIELPAEIDEANVKAKFKDGLLEVRAPKIEEISKSKKNLIRIE